MTPSPRGASPLIGWAVAAIGVLMALGALLPHGPAVSGIQILAGALGLNLAIVGLWVVVRPLAERLRRRLPPWLGW